MRYTGTYDKRENFHYGLEGLESQVQGFMELENRNTEYAEENPQMKKHHCVYTSAQLKVKDVECHVMSRVDLHPSKIHNQIPFF